MKINSPFCWNSIGKPGLARFPLKSENCLGESIPIDFKDPRETVAQIRLSDNYALVYLIDFWII